MTIGMRGATNRCGRAPASWLRALMLALGVCVALLSLPVSANPPLRAARVGDVVGSVWLLDADTRTWGVVVRNQSLGQGDQLRVGPGATVALHLGSATVWLGERAELSLLRYDDEALLLHLGTGALALRLHTAQAAQETRIQTREGVSTALTPGLLRVDQTEQATRVAAIEGRTQFDSDPGLPAQHVRLHAGEQVECVAGQTPRMQRQTLGTDAFGRWMLAQDETELGWMRQAHPLGDSAMPGAAELLRYGHWEDSAEFGPIWTPRQVPIGWEPYRDGHWVWTRHWGWTWVDNAPWGFAPFHYGRWAQVHGRWVWAPGRVERRPAYAPALVSASALLPGGSVSITVGGVARPAPPSSWRVLHPHQPYLPLFRHTPSTERHFDGRRDWHDYDRHRNADGHHRDLGDHRRPAPAVGVTEPWREPVPGARPHPRPGGHGPETPAVQPTAPTGHRWDPARPDWARPGPAPITAAPVTARPVPTPRRGDADAVPISPQSPARPPAPAAVVVPLPRVMGTEPAPVALPRPAPQRGRPGAEDGETRRRDKERERRDQELR